MRVSEKLRFASELQAENGDIIQAAVDRGFADSLQDFRCQVTAWVAEWTERNGQPPNYEEALAAGMLGGDYAGRVEALM
jgi:hypothetical protein